MRTTIQSMRACVLYGAKDLRLETRTLPPIEPGMVLLSVRRAGICGSDLHYFEHGFCGAFVPTQPFILGHEMAGTVEAVSESVGGLPHGTRVAVNPARSCGVCDYCRAGRVSLCRGAIMLGNASTSPPTDGAFAEYVAVHSSQCHPLPPELDDGRGAMLEPLAVALHALTRAGSVAGRRVLVTGAGTIGLLVALTARAFGAAPVVISDPIAERRAVAAALGIDGIVDPASVNFDERLKEFSGDGFDFAFEASGAAAALRQSFGLVRRGGTIVQIGTLPVDDIPLPAGQLMVREIKLLGSFRYANVFEDGIRLLASRRIDPQVLVGGVWPLSRIGEAMRSATGRGGAVKIQVDLGTEDRL
jgi:L-idonate 5-dehydrogenase